MIKIGREMGHYCGHKPKMR